MPELLLELGCEELPASFVEKAYRQLEQEIRHRLGAAGIPMGESTSLGTPRRLIVSIQHVADRQPDQTKEQRGPALKSAYGADGNPTPALLGFCKSQGIDPSALRQECDYVWVSKTIPGRPTVEVLAEELPDAIRSLTFDKSMRWGTARTRFARPIRWILAAFDGKVVPFAIESVNSGLESCGHRFYAPEKFQAVGLTDLLAGLEQRKVQADAAKREATIRTQALAAATGTPELPDALVDENVFLTEWPTAIEGQFKEEFLVLPESVLRTAMAKHERFFPVAGADGKLTNKFVSIRNAGQDDTVRGGNEWVLNARFNDAKFFFDEDQKYSMETFLARAERMTFQEKLGSVRQRADRLSNLTAAVAEWMGRGDQAEAARKAGRFAKADLSCGLVSELPSLQGQIGGEYAAREGFEPEVCRAIAAHYDLAQAQKHPLALFVLLADQIDKLAGYLGVGLVPTGSSDPFGLRRATTYLIEAAWGWSGALPGYEDLFDQAVAFYAQQGVELDGEGAMVALRELFAARYDALLPEARHDLLEAALVELTRPRTVRLRLAALEAAANDTAFVQTATRPLNIVQAALKKGEPIPALSIPDLDSEEAAALLQAGTEVLVPVGSAYQSEDAAALVEALRPLTGPINAFFDSTMVMVEDARVRGARLAMLQKIGELLLLAGDWTKVQTA